jgi:hypothetical protein
MGARDHSTAGLAWTSPYFFRLNDKETISGPRRIRGIVMAGLVPAAVP